WVVQRYPKSVTIRKNFAALRTRSALPSLEPHPLAAPGSRAMPSLPSRFSSRPRGALLLLLASLVAGIAPSRCHAAAPPTVESRRMEQLRRQVAEQMEAGRYDSARVC